VCVCVCVCVRVCLCFVGVADNRKPSSTSLSSAKNPLCAWPKEVAQNGISARLAVTRPFVWGFSCIFSRFMCNYFPNNFFKFSPSIRKWSF
jgi:hypothetical protein